MQYSFDHISFEAYYRTPNMHKHFAKHIIFALEGTLKCKVNDDEFECGGVIIQSDVLHTVDIDNPPMLVYLIDETCNRAKTLDEMYLQDNPYAVLDNDICKRVISTIKSCESKVDIEILKICGLDKGGDIEYDERIKDVLDMIEGSETLEAGIMGDLCGIAFLSESRLSHLFRKQVGISIASYIMFSKLIKAYKYMLLGENITQAAIHSGFSSSSHFATVNKKLFGISTKELGSIQDIFKSAEKCK